MLDPGAVMEEIGLVPEGGGEVKALKVRRSGHGHGLSPLLHACAKRHGPGHAMRSRVPAPQPNWPVPHAPAHRLC